MAVSDILNFIQIEPLVATGGQPSEEQFRRAREAGYEVVINLAPDGQSTSLEEEDELVEALGMSYHHIPVAWGNPQPSEYSRFEALMAANAGRRILIHCQANYRVTAFFALYAESKLGWTRADADALVDRIWTANPEFQMDDTWCAFIAAERQRIEPPLAGQAALAVPSGSRST